MKTLCTSIRPNSLIPDFTIGDYTATLTQKIVAQYEEFVTEEIIKAFQVVANENKIEIIAIDKSVILEMIIDYNEKHKEEEIEPEYRLKSVDWEDYEE